MVDLPVPHRVDTRGLPEGMDPRYLYEYRSDRLQNKPDSGLEKFLYKLMPFSMIKSFAFAIDPFSHFKVAPGVITPQNRTKYRATASVLTLRRLHVTRYNTTYASIVNYMGVGGADGPVKYEPTVKLSDGYYELNPQSPLPQVLHDTTRRTRLMGSTQGEMEKTSSYIACPSRQVAKYYNPRTEFYLNVPSNPFHYPSINGGIDVERQSYDGPAARIDLTTYNNFVASEKSNAIAQMQKHSLSMYKGISPLSRNYTLFRNIVELRDIPRSIVQLRNTFKNLMEVDRLLKVPHKAQQLIVARKRSLSDLPKEYLSYAFGWRQTYKDAVDLLVKPAQIAKQINFILQRNGKPTTYRTKRNFISGASGVAGFDYEVLGLEFDVGYSSRIVRETELRMVVNTTFDFPTVDVPELRRTLTYNKLGVYVRPIDLYNLVPWTWLVDWFTGFGNYLEVIDGYNHDPSAINWGMITAVSSSKLITDFHSTSESTEVRQVNHDPAYYTFPRVKNNHSSICHLSYQLRKDLSTVFDVNATSDPASLTPYQLSILGALLAQRVNFSRGPKISSHL